MSELSFPNETPARKEDIIRLCSQPHRRNYCCLMARPGLYGWMVELEYTKYKPDTDANDNFHMMVCKFPEYDPVPQLTVVIISIDQFGQSFAEAILWKHGLKALQGKVIKCLGPKGPEEFFLHGPNTYVLENHSQGAQNVIYTNDPAKMQKAREHEHAFVQRFFDEHKAWLKTPEGQAIAEAYWKKHPSGRVY